MARNVKIKARVADLDRLSKIAASISDAGPTEIFQDDTFFACPQGRLKLRVFHLMRRRTSICSASKTDAASA